jgi:hypothetical protein
MLHTDWLLASLCLYVHHLCEHHMLKRGALSIIIACRKPDPSGIVCAAPPAHPSRQKQAAVHTPASFHSHTNQALGFTVHFART